MPLPRSPRTLHPISLQLVSSGLEPVLQERARARISEGSQKGQGLGVGVRCPSLGGFEPVPSHPEEDPVTLRMTRQAQTTAGRHGGRGSCHGTCLILTMGLRKMRKITSRYKNPRKQQFIHLTFPLEKEETTGTWWVPGWVSILFCGWHSTSLCPGTSLQSS